ncbi:tyrosine-type recombinase/integrase [Aeromicrobium senzhongii]|uniref:Tyrosine-type recombinase/integrase n=1 Tax=Aeromicrobium senzhongii TaxID=2663859 RepID=A0ABX6STV9_9ACTN|nr:site-specific integrase [Aeromicrobium senzhongii]MTB88443.1 tyrosine-type recombinase/integrase [Aeromicrobium senzhongii]QNL94592.1 tyrosine-type recombinase/integrase [Aeromicrobium senzhongii]
MTSKSTTTRNPSTARRRSSRRTFGAIRKLPSGRYQARYQGPDGRDHTAPTTFARKDDADAWLATVRADMVRGSWRDPDAGSVTVATYFAEWLEGHQVRPRTRENYQQAADRWLLRDLTRPAAQGRPARTMNLGAYELRHLTPAVIREWLAIADADQRAGEMARRRSAEMSRRSRQVTGDARWWAHQNGYQVSSSGRLPRAVLNAWQAAGSPTRPDPDPTPPERPHRAQVITTAYRVLRACLNTAASDGLILANPCQIPRAGLSHTAEREPATPTQVNALAAAMPDHLSAAVHVAAWSGLRAGELFALAREHVDIDAGTVRVTRALVELDGQPITFGPPKTTSSLRTVALPPHVVPILAEHLDTHTAPGPDALVFTDIDGSPLSTDRRTDLFRRARQTIGRPDLRWHDLRHTGATLAAQAGATTRELQHRFGHSTYVASMRYQHASAERDREIADRLSRLAANLTAENVVPLNRHARQDRHP